MEAKKVMRFLVTDYDQCAFTLKGTNSNFLSKSLLTFATNNHYDGFYGCTHRSYNGLTDLKSKLLDQIKTTDYSAVQLLDNYSTYKITEHFQIATQLTCLGVSSIDDIVLGEFGAAFNGVIKPFEMYQIDAPKEIKYLTAEEASTICHSKNLQLLQIAQDVSEHYPNVTISLDYVDDLEVLCQSALVACNDVNWPDNVSLNVYRHCSESDDAPITLCKENLKKQAENSSLDVIKNSITTLGFFGRSKGALMQQTLTTAPMPIPCG